MVLFIILNATLKLSQHLLLWKCGWKPRYALIFPSAVHVLLCISFWVSNSLFSGEIPTIWSVHMLMVSLSDVQCHWRTSSQKPMPTVKLSPGFVGHPLLFLHLTQVSMFIVSLPKKSLLGYSTQMICITCIYPSYLLLSLHLPWWSCQIPFSDPSKIDTQKISRSQLSCKRILPLSIDVLISVVEQPERECSCSWRVLVRSFWLATQPHINRVSGGSSSMMMMPLSSPSKAPPSGGSSVSTGTLFFFSFPYFVVLYIFQQHLRLPSKLCLIHMAAMPISSHGIRTLRWQSSTLRTYVIKMVSFQLFQQTQQPNACIHNSEDAAVSFVFIMCCATSQSTCQLGNRSTKWGKVCNFRVQVLRRWRKW